MAGISVSTAVAVKDVKFTPSSLQSPNIPHMAEMVLTQALEFCAQKVGVDSVQTVVDRLRQGDSACYGYWRYGLANQVMAQLRATDENVKAIYSYDCDDSFEDIPPEEIVSDPLIHLIVWVKRKTAAFNALVEALDRALVERYAHILFPHQLKFLLDVHLVDDSDVENRRGYGLLLYSLHHQPLLLWKR